MDRENPRGQERGATELVTAVIEAVAGGVTTLITALFATARVKNAGIIKVFSEDGRTVEIPVTVSPEQFGEYVDQVNRLKIAHIHVSGAQPAQSTS